MTLPRQLDPVVQMLMNVPAEEYAERIQGIESRLRHLQSPVGEQRSYKQEQPSSPVAEEQGRSFLKSVGSFLTLWTSERIARKMREGVNPEWLIKAEPDDLRTKVGSLIASGRKLTEAQLLRGGASWHISPVIALGTWEATGRTAEVFAATPEQTEAARQEMNEALGISSEQSAASSVAGRDRQRGMATMGGAEEWEAAARRYDEAARPYEDDTFHEVAMELTAFLGSPQGEAAMKLIRASGLRIVFSKAAGEEKGWWTVSCLDRRGLSIDLGVGRGQTRWLELKAENAVKAAWFKNTRDPVPPDKFMPWLRGCLDAIARGEKVPGVERDGSDSR